MNLAAILAGAGTGFVAGGPVGAVIGGIAGGLVTGGPAKAVQAPATPGATASSQASADLVNRIVDAGGKLVTDFIDQPSTSTVAASPAVQEMMDALGPDVQIPFAPPEPAVVGSDAGTPSITLLGPVYNSGGAIVGPGSPSPGTSLSDYGVFGMDGRTLLFTGVLVGALYLIGR